MNTCRIKTINIKHTNNKSDGALPCVWDGTMDGTRETGDESHREGTVV